MNDQASFDKAIAALGEGLADADGLIAQTVPGHRADIDALHEVFHDQSKYHRTTAQSHARNILAHINEPSLIERSVSGRHLPAGHKVLSLPTPCTLTGDVSDVLGMRKSARREDLAGPLDGASLSAMLFHGARISRSGKPRAAPHLTQHYRPYPSAGALYPCEIYLAIGEVESVPRGIYRYDALEHGLVAIGKTNGTGFMHTETNRAPECAVPCAFIMTGVFERSVRKYDLRGYRFALLEAGHILQNLSLLAAALGLSGLVSSSFYEAELEALIGVDGVSEAVLATFLLGAGQVLPPST